MAKVGIDKHLEFTQFKSENATFCDFDINANVNDDKVSNRLSELAGDS